MQKKEQQPLSTGYAAGEEVRKKAHTNSEISIGICLDCCYLPFLFAHEKATDDNMLKIQCGITFCLDGCNQLQVGKCFLVDNFVAALFFLLVFLIGRLGRCDRENRSVVIVAVIVFMLLMPYTDMHAFDLFVSALTWLYRLVICVQTSCMHGGCKRQNRLQNDIFTK